MTTAEMGRRGITTRWQCLRDDLDRKYHEDSSYNSAVGADILVPTVVI